MSIKNLYITVKIFFQKYSFYEIGGYGCMAGIVFGFVCYDVDEMNHLMYISNIVTAISAFLVFLKHFFTHSMKGADFEKKGKYFFVRLGLFIGIVYFVIGIWKPSIMKPIFIIMDIL